MKTNTTRIFIIFLILFLSTFIAINFSDAQSYPDREIVVYIAPQFIDFPDSTDDYFSLSNSGINSSNLNNLLDTFGVVNISRAFPQYAKADTILISSEGINFNISLFTRVYVIQLNSKDNVDELINKLNELHDEVIFAEKNEITIKTGSDPSYNYQWYLKNTGQFGTSGKDIKIEQAWNTVYGGSRSIALIDAGVDLNHRDLSGRVFGDGYYHQINSDPEGNTTTNHGTQMAGIIGAVSNNQYDIKGINWTTTINSYRIFNDGVNASDVETANKILSSLGNNYILNCSFESEDWYHLIRYAYKIATDVWRRNVISITGNQGTVSPRFPGAFNSVISVGALDYNGNRTSYSNYGPTIDLVAYGGASGEYQTNDRILSTSIGSHIKYGNGTSQAGAMVSGLVSLMVNYRNLDRSDIEGLLKTSCDDLHETGWDQYTGYGVINADKAIKYMRNPYSMTSYGTSGNITGGSQEAETQINNIRVTGANGWLNDGYYYFKQLEVHKTVNFTIPIGHSFIGVWAKTYYQSSPYTSMNGWGRDFGFGGTDRHFTPSQYCEVVPGSLTSNSVTLKTYIYKVYTRNPAYHPETYIGTFPVNSVNDVSGWMYTVLSKNNSIRFIYEYDYSGSQTVTLDKDTVFEADNEVSDFYVRDSTKIVLLDSAVLELPDNYTLHFVGKETSLKLNSKSKIKFGVNSKIVFDSSATLIANGATFTSLDSSGKWEGIVLQNSGEDTIMNCIFSNAKTSITIINNPASSFVNRVIKENTFNVPSGSQNHYGIYGENNFRILIKDNVINMPSNPTNQIFGVYLKNNILNGNTQLITEEEGTPTYQIYLINNTFNNGTVSVVLDNYTSAYLPYYVKNNIFNSASMIGILGKYISGSIKDNKISYSGTTIPMGIHLITSSPDLYQNFIGSDSVSLHTIGSSYPNLAPIVSGSNMSWTGGKNRLTSFKSDNIHLVNSGNVYTKLGENRFTIMDTINSYHIYGKVDSTVYEFNAMNNCWYPGGNARIDLRRTNSNVPIICKTGVTSIDCSREIDPNGWLVEYMGNGIYDSIKQTADTAGSNLTPEEHLYYQGKNYLTANLYLDGISSFKDLIDTYNYFDYLPASVYDLYSSYVGLDSADTNQSHINIRYGNLKDYLDDKIYNNGDFDAEFIANAYNVTIMCDANMQNYNNAANAYEFMALYHPDPDIRLNASWDYAEIEALMGGGYGGGERDLGIGISNLELNKFKEINEINRINEIISNDPIMSIMKKTYEKITKERVEKNKRIEKQINDDLKTNEKSIEKSSERSSKKSSENLVKSEQFEKQKESDRFKNEKAKRNIFELKNLNKQELEKRRIEDLLLTAKDERNTTSETDQNISNPLDFSLSQNYPNPFNPVTNLEFQIPNSGLVTLKIYDLLGKEIATIVNENLNPGNYRYKFDGSNFASGVYFYKLEYGDFVAVKRMVLVK